MAGVTSGLRKLLLLYDAEGSPIGFLMNGIAYTYVKNIQGDIIKILDNTGAAVVSYTYDPWGVPTATGNTIIAEINPCTYRGYDYDEDTGYFYLQSRYYAPENCRFISLDQHAMMHVNSSKGTQYNLFAYCNNSPIGYSDPSGETIVVSAVLGAMVAGATYYLEYYLGMRKWRTATFFTTVAIGAILGAAGAWARAVALAKIVKAAKVTNRFVRAFINAALWGGIAKVKATVNKWVRSFTMYPGETWGKAIKRFFAK